MNKIMKCLTAALTVGLLSTSPVAYSDYSSHTAIVDAFDATYDHFGINDTQAQLCGTFGGMASHLVVIDANLDKKRYDCSL